MKKEFSKGSSFVGWLPSWFCLLSRSTYSSSGLAACDHGLEFALISDMDFFLFNVIDDVLRFNLKRRHGFLFLST